MALASVTLSYGENLYTFTEDDQTVLKGRLGCDCGKSELIRETCDSEFPLLKCGVEITVVSVVEAAADREKKPVGRERNRPNVRRASASN